MRPLIGHDPGRLLVPSALTCAALLLAADIAVRLIPSTTDIKVGVLTSIIGVPFFLYLIVRERRALGGGVVGPNGAGKTTLLRALAGLLPSSGEVHVGGDALSSLSLRNRARRFGYLPQ
eukprot:gene49254-66885_t